MPDLVLENVPPEVYEDLRQSTEAHRRSLAEEALERLKGNATQTYFPDEPSLSAGIPAPSTAPFASAGKTVNTRRGGRHLPDPPWITTEDR
jgi:hypothetical protein